MKRISFECEHCNTAISMPTKFAGKQEICPHCQKDVLVPGKAKKAMSRKKRYLILSSSRWSKVAPGRVRVI